MNALYFILLAFLLMLTIWIFFNTMITKKWRNNVSNKSNSWKFGVLYYNPLDKRIFLPKRTGLGYTLNFARPLSVIIFLFIIFAVVCLIQLQK